MMRINHEEAYSLDGACTNRAAEFFNRMRRAELGHLHHIAGYLLRYAQESSSRKDHRRMSNGDHIYRIAELAMRKKVSPDFAGFWRRAASSENSGQRMRFSG